MTTRGVGPAERRLAEMGVRLPEPPVAVAEYVPYRVVGTTVYVSGQIAMRDGQLVATGKLGGDVDVAGGRDAARACAMNVLAQLRAAGGGSLDNIRQLTKVSVFVASTPEFVAQPQVADGASRLFTEVLGPAGQHARSAVGVAVLPLDTPVEIEAIAELDPSTPPTRTFRSGVTGP